MCPSRVRVYAVHVLDVAFNTEEQVLAPEECRWSRCVGTDMMPLREDFFGCDLRKFDPDPQRRQWTGLCLPGGWRPALAMPVEPAGRALGQGEGGANSLVRGHSILF